MKHQVYWIKRLVSLAVCVFVALSMGFHFFSMFGESYRSVTAVLMTTSESLPVSGIAVREEDVFQLPSGLIEFTSDEAERVSVGQTIAVSFQSEEARKNSLLLEEKTGRRSLLQTIAGRVGLVTDMAALDTELRFRAAGLLSDVSSGRLSALDRQSDDIKALLFQQAHASEGTAILLPRIEQLNHEIAALQASVSGTSTALRAESPGLFSALTDGLESVWTPEAIKGLRVSEFRAKSTQRSRAPDEGKGRLVRGWTWRFVCVMPAFQAKTLGSSAAIRFSDGFLANMRVESVSNEEDGECVVVFSSDRYINRFISARRLNGELLYGEYEGVRVPWEGLRVDGETGGYFVYCLLLGRVVRKDVTLYRELERDQYYLAEYHPELRNSLKPGDEIIVAGKDPYDGKIIR
jgi:hypothetical protein